MDYSMTIAMNIPLCDPVGYSLAGHHTQLFHKLVFCSYDVSENHQIMPE